MTDIPASKVCTKCGEDKDLGEFHVLRRNRDGRNSQCKKCVIHGIHRYKTEGPLLPKNSDVPCGSKRCTVCKEVKLVNEFRVRRDRRDGRSERCRLCLKSVDKIAREKHAEKIKETSKRYYESNRDRILEESREKWAERVRSDPDFVERNRVKARRMYRKHAESRREYMRRKRRDPKYRELSREYNREYHKNNRDTIIPRMVARNRERYETDPDFRSYIALRGVLNRCIREAKTGDVFKPYAEDVGYTSDDLKKRMEVQFKPGMDWLNHGEWHVDHKIPVSRFLERGETRPHVIHALSNLQPMWAEENMRKGARWVG